MEHTIKIKDKKVYDSLLAFLKTMGINLSGEKVQERKTGTNLPAGKTGKYPLEGTLLKYDDPFGPATTISDWAATK